MTSLRMNSLREIAFRAALIFFALPISLAPVQAQGVGSSRGLPGGNGRHTIKGRVYTPSGRPYEAGLKVRLDSDILGSSTTNTDSDGVFVFNNLPAGNYTIVIDAGPNFEATRESVTIHGNAPLENVPIPQSLNVSISLREKGAVPGAARVLNAALAGVPKPAVDLFYKARESAAKGAPQKAIDQLKAALAIHSDFALALSELGVQYLKLGHPEKAVEALEKALKLVPDEVIPRLNLGFALLNLKRYEEAEKELREVIRQKDSLATAHMYLGIVLMSQKRLEEAEQELLKAVASKSVEVANAHRYLGGIYWSKREYKKAADELEIYLKLSPQAPDAERMQTTIKELRSKQ